MWLVASSTMQLHALCGLRLVPALAVAGLLRSAAVDADGGRPLHLDLAACRARAVEVAPEVAIAAADARAGALGVDVAGAARLPAVRAESGYVRSSVDRHGAPDFVANNGRNEYIARAIVSQPLFAGGALRGERDRAVASAAGARDGLLAVRVQVSLAADRAYFGSLLADQRQAIAADAVRSSENQLRAARTRLGLGEIAALDVGRFELESSTAATTLAAAAADAAGARSDLATLLQLSDEDFELDPPAESSPPRSLPEAELAQVLRDRPDLRQQEAEVAAAEAAVAVARGARLPQVAAEVAGGWDSLHAPDGRNPGWQVGINVTIPVWDWNALARREDIARLEVEKARQRFEAARRVARNDVLRRARELDLARERLAHAEVSATVAERNVTAARRGYELGLVSGLDLVTAERDGMAARLEHVVARYAVRLAGSEYDFAVGRLP